MINLVNTPSADGIASLSTVWAIMQAARAGAADATVAARGFIPAATRVVSTGLHAAGYLAGFTATFPVVFVARIVPSDNAVVYGLTDGGRAAVELARTTLQTSPGELPKLAALEPV